MKILFSALTLVLLSALPVSAQTTKVNPTQAVFTASTDHMTVLPDGSSLMTGYRLRVLDGATTTRTENLGKPTPNAQNDIAVPLTDTGLQKNKTYTFQIDVVWTGGFVEAAAASNPFYFAGAPSPASNLRAQ